ncbi:hypothetical protein RhiirA4_470487 [Rhizophagus irregularis]|uniref:Uncharacterized protein n=1 Tax=Rhizophagus irregularis TaxID=588596 RepID=A0A2I1H1H4_9GLOM|nr:hypothetical protein RhiirA4_470487 [Rhizophagus irregularis]
MSITLLCLVKGNTLANAFPVDIIIKAENKMTLLTNKTPCNKRNRRLLDSKRHIHVIVESPGIFDQIRKWPSVASVPEEENDSVKRRKIQEGYAKMVNICEKACGPSTGGVPSVFAENQIINSTIFMGRPIDQTGPPIKLMATASQFFNDENARNQTMKTELGSLFGEPLMSDIWHR